MESIGKRLKEARLEKKLTLEELQQATKIQKKHLKAIEGDAFDELPSSYYARTFIKQYAAEVGVDATELINVFDAKKVLPSKPVVAAGGRRSAPPEEGSNNWRIRDSLPLILLFLTALLIIGGVAYATLKTADDKGPIIDAKESLQSEPMTKDTLQPDEKTNDLDEESSEQMESEEKNKEKLTVNYLGTNGYDSSFSLTGASKDIEIELSAIKETCWVGIQVEGEYVHDEMLPVGKSFTYNLTNKPSNFSVVVGDVSHLKIKMNGQEVNYNPEKEEAIKKNAHFSVTYN